MTGDVVSALVVLHPGPAQGLPPERAGEAPPDPAAAAQTVGWFQDRGFETGPFVGISFSVTGTEDLFRSVLGPAPLSGEPGGDRAYSLDALGDDVRPLVAAIVVPAPPDFGPGGP
jgi:hypothetical protein